MHHLTIRTAWHDSRWTGAICRDLRTIHSASPLNAFGNSSATPDASVLYDYTRPERSEMARRNTNLFRGAARAEVGAQPYAEHLIHKTLKGHFVHSKSELVIANLLHAQEIDYHCERPLEGTADGHRLRPDFSFFTPAGDVIIWEHLGMLSDAEYRAGWEWKRQWYAKNGFLPGETLFTTEEGEGGGLDSGAMQKIAQTIKAVAI